ncbi:hypothetical protein CFOL_v3_21233 [Cephalotus follicularis]|uniref:Uncharacterized protein n=1 Tax=Cephalotus follicularis TaxID=3775 RepID=A0A1Q3CCH0_CEPFO|nr:hypothetical protein CFOL_v3_21233 [Cephalotus follicularis]
MESSQLFGDTEECHSSESGWTMYIGSPVHSDDGGDADGHSHSGDDENDDDPGGDDDSEANSEDDSDDSMASDASSGPSRDHQGNPYGYRGHGMAHEEGKGNGKHCLEKGANKAVKKERAERSSRKEEKEESVVMATRANNTATHSGSKVRKSTWKGKRK